MKSRVFLIIAFFCFVSTAFSQNKMGPGHAKLPVDCKKCHVCEVPTRANPCLADCPRQSLMTVHRSPEDGPGTVVMKNLSGPLAVYSPVTFSHRVHAEMADMSGGCAMCHHYNPPGVNILPCKECHETSRKRTDISKPDLKGAYHRQCMDCHRSWSKKTECAACHTAKGSKSAKPVLSDTKTSKHIPLTEPLKKVYATSYNAGKLVTFYHNEHKDIFGLECVSCHSHQSCSRCHDKTKATSVKKKSLEEKHSTCSKCHNVKTSCKTCHRDKEMEPFQHERRTGFALNRFHAKLACTKCHTKAGKFVGLSRECKSCHIGWTQETFDHKITGLKLDEIHSAFECADCHADKSYAKPDCKKCHEDKTYPKTKPGQIVTGKQKAKR